MNTDPLNTIILALLVKSGVYLSLALAGLWLLRHRSAAAQSQLLRTVLVGLVLLAIAGVVHPIWTFNAFDRASSSSSPQPAPLLPAAPIESAKTMLETQSAGSVEQAVPVSIASEMDTAALARIAEPQRGYDWLFILWAVGATICFLRFLTGCFAVWRTRVSAEPVGAAMVSLLQKLIADSGGARGVAVRSHAGLTSPVSFGLFRPMILLPGEHRGWSQAELSMVLRHELAHVRRWDSAFLWLAEICRAVFWMNPLVWIAVKQMRSADERAADDLVLQGGDDANSYAGFLLELARKTVADVAIPAPTSAISAMAQPSTVRMRVERILDESQARRRPRLLAVLVTVITAATLAVLIGGGMTASAQDQDGKPAEGASSSAESTPSEEEEIPPPGLTKHSGPSASDGSQLIIEKMRRITFPSIQFENARLDEVVTYFRVKSRELDTVSHDDSKRGINFVVKSVPDETITLSLKNVPLVVALKAATDLAGMRYRVEPFAVVIVPRVEKNPELYTRVFMVKPSFLSDSGLGRDVTAKEVLTAAGVAFPEGASAHFDPTNSKLIVRNSANSLDIVQSYIEQSSRGDVATLAVSVEIYALSKIDALKLLSEHRNKSDVSDVAKDLQQRVDGDKVKLMASPHFMTRKGVAASIESGEKIEYVSGYVEKDGRDVPVNRTAFAGTRVEVVPIMGADGFTIDAQILVVEGLGEPKIEKRKVVAPVSGKEVEVSSVRLDELTLNTVTTIMAGQTKLVGVMNPAAHLNKDESHVVFLKIDRVAAWEQPKPE